MQGFNIFTEKEVRKAILKKCNLVNINKNSGHWTADIEIEGEIISFIKIPNPHRNEFRQNKAKRVAEHLLLNSEQYNDFVKCNMKAKEYEEIIKLK